MTDSKRIAELLEVLFSRTDLPIRDAGPCPWCRKEGVDSQVKTVPALDAEARGASAIGAGRDSIQREDSHWVFCPRCRMWEHPSLVELQKWIEMNSDLSRAERMGRYQ